MSHNDNYELCIMNNELISQLCRAVEQAVGKERFTRRDFDSLETQIQERLNCHISITTLKRVWGYVTTDSEPRTHTLDILSQFIGYSDFRHFCFACDNGDPNASSPVLTQHINVEQDLVADDTVTLYWNPGRICTIRYLGDRRFVVTESEKTRLVKDATFQCNLIIEGEPLYISNLILNNQHPVGYVCGKKGGIHFQLKKNV